ncbi:MAG: phosphatidate cytidylyltransferase [Chlamydiae bacterium]|nr:phosphatidate cytidylyltransferase [Chlamydiota bacterium]
MSNFVNFKKRFLESIILIGLIILMLTFSDVFFVKIITVAAVSFLAAVASFEFLKLLEQKNIVIPKPFFIISAVLQIISFFLASQIGFGSLPLAFFFLFLFVTFLLQFKTIEGSILKIASTIFSFIYVTAPLGLMLSILYKVEGDGMLWLIYLLLVTKIADIGGYLGGSLFGRNKLSPNISPNKTIEGFISGLLLSLLASITFGFLFQGFEGFDLSFLQSCILGFLLGTVGQIGDLCESLLKRDAAIKDSNALAGLGGVLDMLDSLVFNVPLLYFFLQTEGLFL